MNEVYEPGMVDDARRGVSFGAALYARKYWVLIPTLLAFLLALAYVTAGKVANEVAATYLARQTDAERDLAKDAADTLANRINVLSEKLARAADEVERYRAASASFAPPDDRTISAQQPADLNTDLARARTDEANSQAKATLIRQLLRNGRVSESPDVANSDLVRRISEQRATANAQLASESGTLGPRHPRILELKAEIGNLEAQLRQAASDIASSLENDSRIAAARVAEIQTALDQQTQAAEAAKETTKQIAKATAEKNGADLRTLEQLEANDRAQLESATAKYQEALSRQSGAALADARIIAAATAPDQSSFPEKSQFIGLATLAAFVLSFGIAFGGAIFRDRSLSDARHDDARLMPVRVAEPEKPPTVSTSEPLDRLAGAHVESPEEELVQPAAADEPDEKAAASSTPPPGVNIVATRLNKSKEATDALINFARTLARDGRPIIVDLESRDSELAKLIGLEALDGKIAGLTDLLDGDASFADVIHRDADSRLHFVPFGSKDTLDPDDLDLVLDALSRTYDFVILAAPPFPGSPMTKALAPYADFVVLATPVSAMM